MGSEGRQEDWDENELRWDWVSPDTTHVCRSYFTNSLQIEDSVIEQKILQAQQQHAKSRLSIQNLVSNCPLIQKRRMHLSVLH